METDITEKEFRQNETKRTRSPATGNRQVSGPENGFPRGSILESQRSMAQMGEFPIMTIACNGIQRDQQDPKMAFVSCYVHARATHRLGFSNKCITGWKHDRD
jgi:hypothetical protein